MHNKHFLTELSAGALGLGAEFPRPPAPIPHNIPTLPYTFGKLSVGLPHLPDVGSLESQLAFGPPRELR